VAAGQLQFCDTPQLSGNATLHWFPHWLVGGPQHVPALVHSWPPEHVQACDTPQLSATETLHRPAQLLVGVQQVPPVPHSPAVHAPLHWTV
jgi:hypothetical protein